MLGVGAIQRFGEGILGTIREVGAMTIMLVQAIGWIFRPPLRIGLTLRQMEFVGAGSFFIVFLTGTFAGLVLALQLVEGFGRFNAENLVGSTIAIALTRELGPVLTGLIVTGRVASAMATELGTMRVTEQIDALQTMAVNPIQYLVLPRILAGITMIPILTMFFNVLGMSAAYWISVEVLGIDAGAFMRNVRDILTPADIAIGVWKSVAFGVLITTVACYKGFNAKGGARGVGQATTGAVVFNFIAIFLLDYVITVLDFA
ncbi:MAG: phospholipid/cholesterol/gamma-HCH transport system permease protein [Myxococcota bacterium]|jgi:phospholipid/cholesterol/gamma-HCH transport system permease protein